MNEYFDKWSILTILATFFLFVLALFVKGFTQDLLLEAGVFLVSVKLILGGYKTTMHLKQVREDIAQIKTLLTKNKQIDS